MDPNSGRIEIVEDEEDARARGLVPLLDGERGQRRDIARVRKLAVDALEEQNAELAAWAKRGGRSGRGEAA